MTLPDGWHPVALAHNIEPGTSTGTRIDGVELVVWRDVSGRIHVWDDRCPHRGMKMSFGFVRGDHIACLYHGWQYDTAGQCRLIPARPDLKVPEAIRIGTYPAIEKGGVVWTCHREGEEPPDLDEAIPVRSLYVDRDASSLAADLTARGARSLHDRVCQLPIGEESARIAMQSINEAATALHIVVDKQAGRDARMGQRTVSAWAQRYRLEAETR
ncbi:MAG: Rieske (2Fe-2S) protein [Pseudomonadota bacterium]